MLLELDLIIAVFTTQAISLNCFQDELCNIEF